MPCLHGIDVSVVTHPGAKKLPEFPHSGASSGPIPPPDLGQPDSRNSKPTSSDEGEPRVQKADPRVSVYIPSTPGSQFGINYAVSKSPELSCHLYFKLFLNGRNVTNWGTNCTNQTTGSVTRTLFEPDDRWHYKENGVVHKREGIEVRCFYFLPASSSASVADDGGLVEVQVFRSKGRKRVTPVLGQHRGQECYGIASPSGGLLENPEEAHYYRWLLIDPREYPFVSFRFHYRSWTNLWQLSLVPASAAFGELETRVPSPLLFNSQAQNFPPSTIPSKNVSRKTSCSETPTAFVKFSKDPGPVGHSWSDSNTFTTFGRPSIYRPLPETPDVGALGPRKSPESYAPSIASSLLSYIEEGSEEGAEAEFGLATQIPIESNSALQGKSQHQTPQKNQLGSHVDATSTSSSCSWPLVDVSPGQQLSTVLPLVRNDLPASEGPKRVKCEALKELSPRETRPSIESNPTGERQDDISEGECIKRKCFKCEPSVTRVTGVMVESVKRTGFRLAHSTGGCLGGSPSKKILRSLVRRGVKLVPSQAPKGGFGDPLL